MCDRSKINELLSVFNNSLPANEIQLAQLEAHISSMEEMMSALTARVVQLDSSSLDKGVEMTGETQGSVQELAGSAAALEMSLGNVINFRGTIQWSVDALQPLMVDFLWRTDAVMKELKVDEAQLELHGLIQAVGGRAMGIRGRMSGVMLRTEGLNCTMHGIKAGIARLEATKRKLSLNCSLANG